MERTSSTTPAPASALTRRAALGLAAAAGLVTMTGCSGSGDNASSTSTDADTASSKELAVYVVSSLATLDPQNDSNSDDNDITGLLGEGLYRYDADGTSTTPGMAESYEVSDDGLTYTFTLKKDMTWQDGEAVTADQFVYSFQRFFDPATASENANSYCSYLLNATEVYNGEAEPDQIGVSAPDDTTLEITLATVLPEPTVLAFLSGPVAYPMRQDKIEEGGDGWSTDPDAHLSNGPYRLEAYSPDEKVVLVRNDAYTGDAPAQADRITFMLYSDASAAQVAIANGDICFYKYADDSVISQMGDDAQVTLGEMFSTAILYMNNGSEPLNDPKLREAVFHAVDGSYSSETLEEGRATVAKGLIGDIFTAPSGKPFREEAGQIIPDFSDDELKAAKDALVEAGYSEDGSDVPTLTFITTSTTVGTERGEFYQALLKDNLGVEVSVEAYDIPTYLDKLTSGDFSLAFVNTSVSCDNVFEMLQNFESSTNNYGIAIDEFDELLAEAATESDPAAQTDLLVQAEASLVSENYAIRPVTYSYCVYLASADVEDLVACGTGNILFNYMKLSSWE